MFKRVDVEEKISGYSYLNQEGRTEKVEVADQEGICAIIAMSPEEQRAYVYRRDIPKLIKALQAAYDHKG